jgi:hypothetical protein
MCLCADVSKDRAIAAIIGFSREIRALEATP